MTGKDSVPMPMSMPVPGQSARSVNTRPHVSIQKTGAAVQPAFPCLFRAVTVPTGPVSYNNLKDLNIFTFLLWLEKLISNAKILASPMPRNHNK